MSNNYPQNTQSYGQTNQQYPDDRYQPLPQESQPSANPWAEYEVIDPKTNTRVPSQTFA